MSPSKFNSYEGFDLEHCVDVTDLGDRRTRLSSFDIAAMEISSLMSEWCMGVGHFMNSMNKEHPTLGNDNSRGNLWW